MRLVALLSLALLCQAAAQDVGEHGDNSPMIKRGRSGGSVLTASLDSQVLLPAAVLLLLPLQEGVCAKLLLLPPAALVSSHQRGPSARSL